MRNAAERNWPARGFRPELPVHQRCRVWISHRAASRVRVRWAPRGPTATRPRAPSPAAVAPRGPSPFAGGVWAWRYCCHSPNRASWRPPPGAPPTVSPRGAPVPTPRVPGGGQSQPPCVCRCPQQERRKAPPWSWKKTRPSSSCGPTGPTKDLWMDRPASAMDARSASQPPPGPIQARKAKWVPHAQGPQHREPSLVCDSQGARMDSAPLSGGGPGTAQWRE